MTYATFLRHCRRAARDGRFLWGNHRTGRISVRLPGGEVRVVRV